MATIRKRVGKDDSVSYQVLMRDKGQKPIYRTFESKNDAKEFIKKTIADIQNGKFNPHPTVNKTLKEAFDAYNREVLDINPKRQYDYRSRLLWWVEKIGHMYLIAITPALVRQHRKELEGGITRRGNGRTAATANRYVAALSALLSYAWEQDWLTQHPIRGLKRLKEPKGLDQVLTIDQRKKLLAICLELDDELYLLVQLALATAARRGELLSLTWRDIDFKNHRITFRDTKNGETRSSYPPAEVFALLSKHQEKVFGVDERVFKCPLKGGKIEKLWQEARTEAGIPKFRFHSLRHTAATYMAQSATNTVELMHFTGHKSAQMVKRYSHLMDKHLAALQEKMHKEYLSGS